MGSPAGVISERPADLGGTLGIGTYVNGHDAPEFSGIEADNLTMCHLSARSGTLFAALMLLMPIPLSITAAHRPGVLVRVVMALVFEALFGGGAIIYAQARSAGAEW